MNQIVFTISYNPELERDSLKFMKPHARHQRVIETQKEDRANRRENHRKGIHKMRFTIPNLR
jgi:hypothetical protein